MKTREEAIELLVELSSEESDIKTFLAELHAIAKLADEEEHEFTRKHADYLQLMRKLEKEKKND